PTRRVTIQREKKGPMCGIAHMIKHTQTWQKNTACADSETKEDHPGKCQANRGFRRGTGRCVVHLVSYSINFEVFIIIELVIFVDFTKHFAWIPNGNDVCRDILRDNTSRTNDCILTNRYPRTSHCSTADPDIVPNGYR